MIGPRLKHITTTLLLDGWSRVVRIHYKQFRMDGTAQDQDRDLLDRGDGVTVLLCNRDHRTVLLLRQPRISSFLRHGGTGETIEACNGLVESELPEQCARREVEQETGHRVRDLIKVGEVYASPGASLELVHLYISYYDESTRTASGGGIPSEGEDIEVFEVSIEQAMEWVENGVISDARTILVLQFAVARHLI